MTYLYLITGSEDGPLGIATSRREAVKTAYHYVTRGQLGDISGQLFADTLTELCTDNNVEVRACGIRAEIQAYTPNRFMGRHF